MEVGIVFSIFELLIIIVIFTILMRTCKFIIVKFKSTKLFKNSRFFNPLEYFPAEKISSLKQASYLITILVFVMIVLYLLFHWNDGLYFISCLDIIISSYFAIKVRGNSFKDKLILFSLIPFGSISRLFVDANSIVILFDLLHVLGYLYFVEVYYRKFVNFTENNGLGITIMLLFAIISVSFVFTIFTENVSPLDSMTMVSNAFTSNSFEVSGKVALGKVNSLVIAWGGFILSGTGTATLAVSIVMRYVNRQFDEMKELIEKKKEEE